MAYRSQYHISYSAEDNTRFPVYPELDGNGIKLRKGRITEQTERTEQTEFLLVVFRLFRSFRLFRHPSSRSLNAIGPKAELQTKTHFDIFPYRIDRLGDEKVNSLASLSFLFLEGVDI